MNGAIADPEAKTIRLPKVRRRIMIGSSQNFFRSFKNVHSSFMNSNMISHLVVLLRENVRPAQHDNFLAVKYSKPFQQ